MNIRKLTVAVLAVTVLGFFLLGMNAYQQRVQQSQAQKVEQALAEARSAPADPARAADNRLVRFHSPTVGPARAPVTLVEFFDPACETCRAFHPIVKDILTRYPDDVRLVIRYAPFHAGADEVVKLLEAARRQNLYLPVLESVLAAQPQWADHGRPDIALAFRAAEQAGLDMARARLDAASDAVAAALRQDIEDLTALEVTRTPTFFVNGRQLPSFGESQLRALVADEVARSRR